MSVGKLYYLTCTDCGDEFCGEEFGRYYGSEEEARDAGEREGWRCRVPVPNGSLWDFCPECYRAFLEDK